MSLIIHLQKFGKEEIAVIHVFLDFSAVCIHLAIGPYHLAGLSCKLTNSFSVVDAVLSFEISTFSNYVICVVRKTVPSLLLSCVEQLLSQQ